MTVPYQMNCPHSGEGWCITCVEKLAAELEPFSSMPKTADGVRIGPDTPIWHCLDVAFDERPKSMRKIAEAGHNPFKEDYYLYYSTIREAKASCLAIFNRSGIAKVIKNEL